MAEGDSAQIFTLIPKGGESKPIIRKNLEGMVLDNFEFFGGPEYYLLTSLPHNDVAKSLVGDMVSSLISYLDLPNINNFAYVQGEGKIDYNIISVIRQTLPGQVRKYILRTYFDDEGVPMSVLYDEFEGLSTLHQGNLENYSGIMAKGSTDYVKRISVPKFNFSEYPNKLEIIGERETLALVIPFDKINLFSEDHARILVASYYQFCTEFYEESLEFSEE